MYSVEKEKRGKKKKRGTDGVSSPLYSVDQSVTYSVIIIIIISYGSHTTHLANGLGAGLGGDWSFETRQGKHEHGSMTTHQRGEQKTKRSTSTLQVLRRTYPVENSVDAPSILRNTLRTIHGTP